MSHKSRAPRPDDQSGGAALRGQGHDSSSRPTREQALDALCTVIAYAMGRRAEPTVYDQRHLPPDAKSGDAYLRRHRALRAAGVPGVWMRGKVAACTPEAWAHDLPRAPRLAVVEPARDLDTEVAAALGIRARRTS